MDEPGTGSPGEPSTEDVLAASVRLRDRVLRTPVLRCERLDELAGAQVWLKCENLQHVGAFKARGALNAVLSLPEEVARRGVAAHSSGNHAAALAYAGRQRGVPVTVVMPSDAPSVKFALVRRLGARVVTCAPTLEARTAALEEVVEATGATEIHPYDDAQVIAGAGTAALELLEAHPDLQLVVAPVSGGGLLSGTALAAQTVDRSPVVWGAEPATVDDAARSLATGVRQPSTGAATIADGLVAVLSDRTFAILGRWVDDVVVVTEQEIVGAMRLLFDEAKLVVEPSGAAGVAAVLARAGELPDQVGVVISGGNVDLDRLPFVDRA